MQRFHVFRAWKVEILSVLLAFGLITSIAALLTLNNEKPVPDWGNHINFNALLAVVSTVLRATLVIIVSSIISQRKWECRGIFGALLLLPTIIRRDAVALSAIIVLLASFLIGPFVQQASHTEECWFALPGPNASLPSAHYVPRLWGYSSTRSSPIQELLGLIMSAAMAPDGPGNQISATCITGNCTFSGENQRGTQNTTHSTVGMCNKCVDVSSLDYVHESKTLRLKNVPKKYNISDHDYLAIIRPIPDLAWLGDLLTPELRAISRWAYINSTSLAKDKSGEKAVAAVCSLYPCLRTYNASITHNQLSEREVRSDPMRVILPEGFPSDLIVQGELWADPRSQYAAVKSPCVEMDGGAVNLSPNISSHSAVTELALYDFTDYGLAPYHITRQNITAPEECIYRHDAHFSGFISDTFGEIVFNGYCDYSSADGGVLCFTNPDKATDSGDFLDSPGIWGVILALYNNGDAEFSIIARWFDAFANTMTNNFRSRPVWKDSILPFIFSRHIIEPTTVHEVKPQEMGTLSSSRRQLPFANDGEDAEDGAVDHDYEAEGTLADDHDDDPPTDSDNTLETHGGGVLLEESEMKAMGDRILVTFRWPSADTKEKTGLGEGGSEVEVGLPTPPLRRRIGSGWRRRRQQSRPDVDVDSLLGTDR
ncbi:hypothetical protein PG997_002422 [Apiospora hydei]|uniref:Uncharacterized protein n=1 Tax=Apiospora hydei TaxID=1337664 RepID=A0ABR1X9A4_9PEZI